MALLFTQDYKVTWKSETPNGDYRLVCWDNEWLVFLDKIFVGKESTFNKGIELINIHYSISCPTLEPVKDRKTCSKDSCTCKQGV